MTAITTQVDGASVDFVVLAAGPNKVTIHCPDMAVGTSAIIQTSLTNFAGGDVHEHADPKDPDVIAGLRDTDTVSSDSADNPVGREYLLWGPGQVRLWVDSIGASDPITLQAIKAS